MAETLESRMGGRLREFLDPVLREGQFTLSYRFITPPPSPDGEGPELIVDFTGTDSDLLLANDNDLLRSLEYLAFETLRLGPDEHHRVVFDCQGRRQIRVDELRTAAAMAAEQVRKSGTPYHFTAMNSRDRRTVHMALQEAKDLSSESEGEGRDRHIVVRPAGMARTSAPSTRGARREYRRL